MTNTHRRLYFRPAGFLQFVGAAVGIIGSLKSGSDAKKGSRYDAETAKLRAEGEADLILSQADFRNRILARQVGLSARRTLINRAAAHSQVDFAEFSVKFEDGPGSRIVWLSSLILDNSRWL